MNKYSVKMLPSMIKSSERTEPSAAGGREGVGKGFLWIGNNAVFFLVFLGLDS